MLRHFIVGMVPVIGAFSQVAWAARSAPVSIADQGQTYLGDLYVPKRVKSSRKLPLVIVIHEWWGKTDYPAMRGKRIADKLGYAALVVDLYGDGKIASDPKQAAELAGPFYRDPQLAVARIEKFVAAAPEAAEKLGVTLDPSREVAIGYCFGGSQALNYARAGKVNGVVAFHAGLSSSLQAKDAPALHLLVLHGGADPLVKPEDVSAFKKEMGEAHAALQFVTYPGALHAFTNPKATRNGKKFHMPIAYDKKADRDSWKKMAAFLRERFSAASH